MQIIVKVSGMGCILFYNNALESLTLGVLVFPTNLLCTLYTAGMKPNTPNERIIYSKQKIRICKRCTIVFFFRRLARKNSWGIWFRLEMCTGTADLWDSQKKGHARVFFSMSGQI